jgi:hypothetical protein
LSLGPQFGAATGSQDERIGKVSRTETTLDSCFKVANNQRSFYRIFSRLRLFALHG